MEPARAVSICRAPQGKLESVIGNVRCALVPEIPNSYDQAKRKTEIQRCASDNARPCRATSQEARQAISTVTRCEHPTVEEKAFDCSGITLAVLAAPSLPAAAWFHRHCPLGARTQCVCAACPPEISGAGGSLDGPLLSSRLLAPRFPQRPGPAESAQPGDRRSCVR